MINKAHSIMMNPIWILMLASLTATFGAEDFYKFKYNVNLNDVVKNDRLLTNAMNCFTDKGPCTASVLELKRIIPDALENNCKRCSPEHKDSAYNAIKYLTTNKPEVWKALEQKFDPQGKFRAAAKSDPILAKYNIKF